MRFDLKERVTQLTHRDTEALAPPAANTTGYDAAVRLARVELQPDDIKTEWLPAPHQKPSALPGGNQAVYAFFLGQHCLKVAKAGPRNPSAF